MRKSINDSTTKTNVILDLSYFSTLLNCKHDENFSDVKFSAFDAIEKLINFLFKATFAIMQKK